MNVDQMFDFICRFKVSGNVASAYGNLPVSGTDQIIGWDVNGLAELGQADIFVRTVKYTSNQSGSGPGDHFFAVETMKGHPLKGWRFWRVYDDGGAMIVETGAVDENNGLLGDAKEIVDALSIGGHGELTAGEGSVMNLWHEMMDNAVDYSGGQRDTNDYQYNWPQGHWVPDQKDYYWNLVH